MFDNRQIKQVIVVRKDLNMRKGKMCAQVAHGTMYSTLDKNKDSDIFDSWLETGTVKIVVGCSSLDELLAIQNNCSLNNIPNYIVEDWGLTEFHGEKTVTCLAIGPYFADKIDEITSNLKLL